MDPRAHRLAERFDELANLQELAGESAFKVRAYRTVAETLRGLSAPLSHWISRNELESLPGIGKGTAAIIREYWNTGAIQSLEQTRKQTPPSLLTLLRVQGLGLTRVRKLWQSLSITDLSSLILACQEGKVAQLSGFSSKSELALLHSAQALLLTMGHVLLAEAVEIASWIATQLTQAGAARTRTIGTTRRAHEIVSEIRVLCTGLSAEQIHDEMSKNKDTLMMNHLEVKDDSVFIYRENALAPVVIRTVRPSQFLFTLISESCSETHLASLDVACLAQGRSLQDLCSTLDTEDDVYRALGVSTIPPELREGSLEEPPADLLSIRDIRGVFHVHTQWSDGAGSLHDMVLAAQSAGFSYVGISDHSQAAGYANGLNADRLREQMRAIRELQRQVPEVRIFHGIEADVLSDGRIDLEYDVLSELDFVIASIHMNFNLSRDEQTARMVRAVSHPLVTILGHPTGRLLLGRPGYAFDLDEVTKAATRNNVYLEINANAQRLDLSSEHQRQALSHGATFCINPDAHEIRGFGDVALGVTQARRAGLRRHQVLNTQSVEQIEKTLCERKAKASLQQ